MPSRPRSVISYPVYAAFATALIATLASLYMSNGLGLPPCVLCWYQRIAMYPLVILLGVGILRQERALHHYVLPLASVGWLIALYHTLIQWKIIPDSLSPCIEGVSCTTVQINLLGFITIPFMSFVAFSIIILSMVVLMMNERKKHQ